MISDLGELTTEQDGVIYDAHNRSNLGEIPKILTLVSHTNILGTEMLRLTSSL